MQNFDGNFYGNLNGNLMGILMIDSMRWPYDSFDCLSLIKEFGTDCFCLVIYNYIVLNILRFYIKKNDQPSRYRAF